MLHQPVHHGGCGKQCELAHRGGQLHQFGGLEAARQGHDMARATQYLGVVVQARAVRHGRGIDHGVAGGDVVHIGEITGHHGQQVAVRLHDALGAARGARGVEQRGDILRGPVVDLHGGMQQGSPVRVSAKQQQARLGGPSLPRRRGKRLGCQHHACARIGQHMRQLFGMQLVVDRNRHRARPQNSVQRLQIFRTVGRVDDHAVAGHHTALRAQPSRQGRSAYTQGAVAQQHLVAVQHGRLIGKAQGAAAQQVGNVHGGARSRKNAVGHAAL